MSSASRACAVALAFSAAAATHVDAHEGYARREGLSCQVCHVRESGGPLTRLGRDYLWSGLASPIEEDSPLSEPSRLGLWGGDLTVWGRTSRERVLGGTSEYALLQSALRLQGTELLGRDDLRFDGDFFGQGSFEDGDEGVEDESVRAVHAAVRWTPAEQDLDLRLGRFWINEGVATERMDGVSISRPLGTRFEITGFAGVPTEDLIGGAGGDWLAGGRVGYRGSERLSLGLSSFYAADDDEPRDGKVGADLFWSPAKEVDVAGHAFYDWIGGGLYDHRAHLTWKPSTFWHASVDHGRTVPGLLLPKNSIFSVFSDDAFTETSFTLTYRLAPQTSVHVFDRINRAEDGSRSHQVGGGVDLRYGPNGEDVVALEASYVDEDRKDFGAGRRTSDAWFLRASHRLYWTKALSTQVDGFLTLYAGEPFRRDARVVRALVGYALRDDLDLQCGVESVRTPDFGSRLDALARLTFRF